MKKFYQFLFEKVIYPETLLDSIKSKIVSSEDIFGINSDKFKNLESLYNDNTFNEKLKSKGYKKDNLELTKDYETFLKDSLNVKYFLIFKNNQSELEQPKYMFLQVRNKGNWSQIGLYKVNDDMKTFYDLLTNKTIEIKYGQKNYIYNTTNGGNDWTLQNVENQDNYFKKIMRSEEISNSLTSGVTIEEI